MRKLVLFTLPVAIVLGTAGIVSAQEPGVVAARQAYFKNIGYQAKKMGEIAKSFDPDAAKAQAAELKPLLDTDLRPLFAEGTSNRDIPGENRALPKIWDDFDGFMAREAAFKTAGAQLIAAADAGDAKAFGAAMGQFGGSCKACHDDYRAPK